MTRRSWIVPSLLMSKVMSYNNQIVHGSVRSPLDSYDRELALDAETDERVAQGRSDAAKKARLPRTG